MIEGVEEEMDVISGEPGERFWWWLAQKLVSERLNLYETGSVLHSSGVSSSCCWVSTLALNYFKLVQ